MITNIIIIMKTRLIFLAVLVGVVVARPQNPVATITKFVNDVSRVGNYLFDVETSDGFKHNQRGELKNEGTDEEAQVMTGSYSYVGDDGKTYVVEYIADENGFQPAGEHLPPSAGVKKLGIPSAAQASLIGGGIG